MRRHVVRVGTACLLTAMASATAQAASSITDPLTSFNAGLYTVSAADPVVYDALGAHFGSAVPGDGGRSYQRTVDADYATVNFVAEITFELSTTVIIDDKGTPDIADDTSSVVGDSQQVFFGMGTGDMALFGTPDWSTQASSASFWPEANNNKITRFRTANDVNAFGDTTVAGFDPGVHRLRMTFSVATRQLLAEIDLNYGGGPFVADAVASNFPIVTSSLFAADGWPSEPSRIFFGGDDGAILRDFSVQVRPVPEPASAGLVALGVLALGVRRSRRGR